MFIRAFITMVAADAIDRHKRDEQHRAWVAEEQARAAAAAAHPTPLGPLVYDRSRPERPT